VLRLGIRVRDEDAEVVLAQLLELAPSGVEEVQISPDVVEYAVYGAPGELPALPDLTAAAGGALIEVCTRELPDDWEQRWRAFHRPLVLAGRLTVRPPWEPAGGTPIDVVIDPAQAFGTGAHHTTRLCLELLLELAGAGGPQLAGTRGPSEPAGFDGQADPGPGAHLSGDLGELVDLGCGSGVLAIVAAKLGFSPVLALDHDPLSVQATQDNAARNRVALRVARHDLRRDPPVAGACVAANLLAPLLTTWARRLREAGVLPGRVIASGLLADEADAVAAEFAALGLRESARRVGGEWAALLLDAR
jgi:ribosomal protein L11 methyltransferase